MFEGKPMDKQRILIVHGWMHSKERYAKLKHDMEKYGNCLVSLFEFPGFGETQPKYYFNILNQYTKLLVTELQENHYDYVVGHSMGGNLLLKALIQGQSRAKLTLLSPEYKGIDILKPLVVFYPIAYVLLFLIQKIKCPLTTFLIKCSAFLTINSWDKIDEQTILDVRRASTLVALNTMIELAWDNWRLSKHEWKNGEVHLILGSADRIITKRKMNLLAKQIKNIQIHCIQGIGHTAILENYEELLKTLIDSFGGRR